MRTRIALVAIIPVALITVSTLTQPANSSAAQTEKSPPRGANTTIRMPPNMSVAYRGLVPPSHKAIEVSLPFDRSADQLLPHFVTTNGAATPDTAVIAALAKAHPASSTKTAVRAGPAPVAAPPTTAAAAPPAAPAPAPAVPAGPVDTVTPGQRAAWEHVAMCEEGGDWGFDGSTFSGGLGISRTNWDAYGGTEYAPEGAEATEDEQIMVAERIQSDPPDQYGCRGW